jgi:hypothetical protein
MRGLEPRGLRHSYVKSAVMLPTVQEVQELVFGLSIRYRYPLECSGTTLLCVPRLDKLVTNCRVLLLVSNGSVKDEV